jgi:hypothetical protein
MNKKVLIGTNVYGKYHRQNLGIDSLHKLKQKNTNVDICLVQEPQDLIEYENIQIFKQLKRNSSDLLNTKRKLPFVNDIFDVLCNNCEDYFLFCNSDIILSQNLIDQINNTDIEAQAISRIEIPHINKLSDSFCPIRIEPAGFDCWIFSKKWWIDHKHLFQDYLLGKPYFDVYYAMLMFLHSKNLFISNQYLIYHILHEKTAFIEDECLKFNKEQTFKFYAENEKIWGECCNNTFLKRSDYGRFLNFNSNENEIIQNIKNNIIINK